MQFDGMDFAIKAIKYGLAEENPELCYIKVLNKLIKKVNIEEKINIDEVDINKDEKAFNKLIFAFIETFVAKTFNLLVGHSQFINIMLNRDSNQIQKGNFN